MKENILQPPARMSADDWTLRLQSVWRGIFIQYEQVEDKPEWTVGLVFSERDFAAKVFDEIRSWNEGRAPDIKGKTQVTIVRTDENELQYFIYPQDKKLPYPVLNDSHALIEGILPPEFPPAASAEFLIQAFETKDGNLQIIQEIQPIREIGLKYVRSSELNSADLERFLPRFSETTVLVSEPYPLPLPSETLGYARLRVLQGEYFAILDEFFQRMAGTSAANVSSPEDAMDLTWKRLSGPLCPNEDPYTWVRDKLLLFQMTFREELDRMPQNIGGVKLLLGGGRFSGAYSTAIRQTILYADTILIPDPLLPWIEEEREAEKFQLIPFLQSTYHLLRYKPLVDADLPYPALLVFPTWERTQLAPQAPMREELDRFFVQFMSHHLGSTIDSMDDLIKFTHTHEQAFLQTVEDHHLFVAPETTPGMPIRDSVSHFRQWIEQWRSSDYLKQSREVSDGSLILTGIYERLSPQFMMMRTSDTLSAQPLLAVPSQWHYYTLITKVFTESLASQGLLNPKTITLLRALETEKFHWLGNVPVSALVRLRMEGETNQFREKLNEFISELHSSKLEDVDKVTAEVSRGIASLLAQHQKQLDSIERKYRRTHVLTLGASVITLAASFIPALAPFLGLTAPAALALRYAGNKLEERSDRGEASRSLMGVLTSAVDS